MKLWKLAVLSAPLVVAACSEVQTLPTEAVKADTSRIAAPQQSQRYYESGPQLPPHGVPVEYQAFTTIEVRADVGFMGQTAWGQAVVNYGGTNATALVELVARNAEGSVVASNTGSSQDSHFLPGNYGLTASTSMYVPAACGISAQATARGTVWNAFLTSTQSLLQWGHKGRSDSKDAAQPACIPPSPQACQVVISGLAPIMDCDPYAPPTAPGGGETSPPYSSPSEPPSEPTWFYPPYYTPKRWTETCYTVYSGTDYERRECTRIDDNDTRIARGGTPLAPFRGAQAVSGLSGLGDNDRGPSVFVLVSDAIPAGSMAIVDRNKEGPFKNVILVRSSGVRPAEFLRAMSYLYGSRSTEGESPSRNMSAQLKGTISDSEVTDAEREYAATFTSLLAKAKKGNVGQYGSRPVLEIRMGVARTK